MTLKNIIRMKGVVVALIFFSATTMRAQDVVNEQQLRTELGLSYKFAKKFTLNLTPELRYDSDFVLDKYLVEGELEYKLLKNLTLGSGYQFIANKRSNKATEYFNRFSLKADYSIDINNFEPSVKLKYTNYSEDGPSDNFLRYKAGTKYNIKDSKITPYVSGELFHNITGNQLSKVRYGVGLNYKLFKNNYVQVGYKLDYFLHEYLNRHILTIGYKLKL